MMPILVIVDSPCSVDRGPWTVDRGPWTVGMNLPRQANVLELAASIKYPGNVTDYAPVPLTGEEEAFLRALGRAMLRVPRAFDADLLREQRLSHSEYSALRHLSEAPGQRLRMSDLAAAGALSLSGITRIVTRLEGPGLIQRERSSSDGRGWNAVLSDAGLHRLRQAWPTHPASVRRHA